MRHLRMLRVAAVASVAGLALAGCGTTNGGGSGDGGSARATQRTVFSISGLKNAQHTFMAAKASGDVMRTDVIRYTTR